VDLLVGLIVVGLIALAVFLYLSIHEGRHEAREWHVVSSTRSDGTLLVGIRGPGTEQVVRELPPSLVGEDLQRALRLARGDAQRKADALNRASAERRRS
jgi:hypothetical protein